MVPFFVQFKCKLGQSYTVANALAEAEIASEIYSTAGDYDLLVKFYVDNATDIGHFVNEKVQTIPGIQDTHTIITFKPHSAGKVLSRLRQRPVRGLRRTKTVGARSRSFVRQANIRLHRNLSVSHDVEVTALVEPSFRSDGVAGGINHHHKG
jgi:hypothetical protein